MRISVDTWADYLFPVQCCHCNVWDQGWLCSTCLNDVEVIPHENTFELDSCSGIRALSVYKGLVKDIFHKAKYEDQPWRLARLAQTVAGILDEASWMSDIDIVISMPGDPWRTLKRGFNPARLIAHEIARHCGLPLAPSRAFTRLGSKSQQSLSMEERRKRYDNNIFNTNYSLLGDRKIKKCLLVDDIATTGATLDAAARALRATGFEVQPLVLSIGL